MRWDLNNFFKEIEKIWKIHRETLFYKRFQVLTLTKFIKIAKIGIILFFSYKFIQFSNFSTSRAIF